MEKVYLISQLFVDRKTKKCFYNKGVTTNSFCFKNPADAIAHVTHKRNNNDNTTFRGIWKIIPLDVFPQ